MIARPDGHLDPNKSTEALTSAVLQNLKKSKKEKVFLCKEEP